MWPAGDPTPLHDYQEAVPEAETSGPAAKPRWWSRLAAWGR
jgi:hypothetical protein